MQVTKTCPSPTEVSFIIKLLTLGLLFPFLGSFLTSKLCLCFIVLSEQFCIFFLHLGQICLNSFVIQRRSPLAQLIGFIFQ